MDFNPNKPGKTKQYFWATYIPHRHPAFKMHANRGHALNAFQYKSHAILYKWDEKTEEWNEVYRVEDWRNKDHKNCEGCGKLTLDTTTYTYATNKGRRIWVDKKTDSPRLMWACYDCARQLR